MNTHLHLSEITHVSPLALGPLMMTLATLFLLWAGSGLVMALNAVPTGVQVLSAVA